MAPTKWIYEVSMKKRLEDGRILERRLAKRVLDSDLLKAKGAGTGGTFTTSGTPSAFDDCSEEKP